MKTLQYLKLTAVVSGFLLFSCQSHDSMSPLGQKDTGFESESTTFAKRGQNSDKMVLAKMHKINEQLAAQGLNIAVEALEYFTVGKSRPSDRIHQKPFRWVPNDPRRSAQGNDITYLVDQSDGMTANGLTNAQTEAAIDRAFATWSREKALKKVHIVKVKYDGGDPDIYDSFYGSGGSGKPFKADIVNAGWLPRAFFEAVVPSGGTTISSFSVTFIFTDSEGNPTDINGDHYMDTALNEVYYNDTFGDPVGRKNSPWGINMELPGIDIETAALHENGHSLGLGHFGPPPVALMNPVYEGIRQSPLKTDHAGLSAIWRSWPNR